MATYRKVSVIVCLLLMVFQIKAGGSHHEVYDQVVGRDDIAQFLKDRPQTCPLISNVESHGKVLLRLERSLKSFKCKEAEDSFQIVKEVRSLESSGLMHGPGTGALNLVLEGYSDVLNSISDITKNKECLSGLEDKSFLQSLADIILSVSRWGVFSDNPVQIVGGGILLSSALQVIDSVFFHKAYNWELHSERALFNKINCVFYDIQFNLHNLGVFRSSNEKTRLKEERLKIEIQELEQRESHLKETMRVEEEKAEDERTFYVHAKALVGELGDIKEGTAERAFFIRKLLFLSLRTESILKVYPNVTWHGSMDSKLLERTRRDLERFSIEKYQSNASMINRPEYYYSNLLFTINSIYSFFYNHVIFYEQRPAAIGTNWQKTESKQINRSLAKAQKDIEGISEAIRVKKSLYSSLANRNSKDQYHLDDPGMIEVVGLYQYYDEMGKIVYGRLGKGFLSFLKRRARSSIKNFKIKHKIFIKREYLNHHSSLGVFDLDRACTMARSLVKTWSESSAWGQYLFDFIMTNLDFYQSRGRKFETDSYSALYAKALIAKHQQKVLGVPDNNDVTSSVEIWEGRPFKTGGGGRSVGELMLWVYESSERVERLEDFIQEDCQEISHF